MKCEVVAAKLRFFYKQITNPPEMSQREIQLRLGSLPSSFLHTWKDMHDVIHLIHGTTRSISGFHLLGILLVSNMKK